MIRHGECDSVGWVQRSGTQQLVIFLLSVSVALASCSGYRSTVTPRIAITEEYTDNVALSSVNPESALISTVSPGITYGLTGQNATLNLSYDPSFAYYSQNEETLATRHLVALNARDQLTRYSVVDISGSFTRTDDPTPTSAPVFIRTGVPIPAPDTTIRTTREPYTTNDASTRFRHNFGARDFFYFDYRYSMLNNDDPTLEDNTRHEPSLGLTYWLTPEYGVETTARYTKGNFSSQSASTPASDPLNMYYLSSRWIRRFGNDLDVFVQSVGTDVDYEGQTPDYRVYEATAGVDYHLSQSTFVALSGGYFYQSIDQGEPASGYVLRGDMAKQFSRGSVRLTGGTGYDQAIFGAENLGFTKFYAAGLAARYDLLRHLSAEAMADYRINQYPDDAGREDTITTLSAGLNYLLNPWLRLGLRLAHNKVDSTVSTDSYDENRISFSITMVPPRPYLLEW